MFIKSFFYYSTIVTAALAVLLAFLNRPRDIMPSLAAARASNASYKPLYRPVGLFFGGTSGIGQAMAEQLARQTQGNAHIILLGRNKEAAEKIISGFPKSENSVYEFEKVDATSMRDVRRVTESLSKRLDKVNYIVASTGYLTTKGRDESDEGIDKKLAVNFYGRFRFIHDLVPKLNKAAEQGEDARALSILAAGRGSGYINLKDLGLVKEYSLRNAEAAAITYNDAALSEFAARYPKISFTHAYPGIVTTPMTTGFHWSMKYVIPLFRWLTVTPEECAEYMWSPLLSKEDKYKSGLHRVDNHADPVSPNKSLNPEVIKAVWDHAVEKTAA